MTGDFSQATDPFSLFQSWFDEAKASELNDPNAMAVATVDDEGMPDVRMVLLNGFSDQGFVFYTNTESAKGQELAHQPKAALVFHWKSLRRQSGCAAQWPASRMRKPMPISTPARAKAGLAHGPASNHARLKAALRLKSGWPITPPNMPLARSHVRHTGQAIVSPRSAWNSGMIGPSGCMTACASAAPSQLVPSSRSGFIPDRVLA